MNIRNGVEQSAPFLFYLERYRSTQPADPWPFPGGTVWKEPPDSGDLPAWITWLVATMQPLPGRSRQCAIVRTLCMMIVLMSPMSCTKLEGMLDSCIDQALCVTLNVDAATTRHAVELGSWRIPGHLLTSVVVIVRLTISPI